MQFLLWSSGIQFCGLFVVFFCNHTFILERFLMEYLSIRCQMHETPYLRESSSAPIFPSALLFLIMGIHILGDRTVSEKNPKKKITEFHSKSEFILETKRSWNSHLC